MEAPRETAAESGRPALASGPGRPPPAFGFGSRSDRLGAWNFYFIAKLLLFWRGLIGFHLFANVAFLVLLAVPLPSPRWRRLRVVLAVPAAVALLYYDSWLPSASRALSQAGLLSSFSASYLAELAGRFVSWPVVAMLAIAGGLYFAAARFVRADVFVAVALLAPALVHAPAQPPVGMSASAAGAGTGQAAKGPDALLKEFYLAQAQRSVSFAAPPAGSTPFDVIFLHVCSLSWDDLRAAGLSGTPSSGASTSSCAVSIPPRPTAGRPRSAFCARRADRRRIARCTRRPRRAAS